MGKTKTAFIGETPAQKQSGQDKYEKKAQQKRSAKDERGIRVPGLKGGERVVALSAEIPETPEEEKQEKQRATSPHKRGKRYLAAAVKIDPTRRYAIPDAIELARETSISRFPGTLELHLKLDKKGRFEIALPHQNAVSKKRVEVVSDDTIGKLQAGIIDFDILISTPEFLPKLVPFARLLGPRGLMPNPKNGTLTANPKAAVEKFSGNTLVLQTEKDAPLIHVVVGRLTDDPNHLGDNIKAIIKALGAGKAQKAVISPTMGPGIRLAL